MLTPYQRKVEAFKRQSEFMDNEGRHYKKVNGHIWVLKFSAYCGPTGIWYSLVYWAKVEGWTKPTT